MSSRSVLKLKHGDEPQRKVWRVTLHAKELMDCGFDPYAEDGGWSVILGILKAKQLPDWCVADRTPCRVDVSNPEKIVLEFDG